MDGRALNIEYGTWFGSMITEGLRDEDERQAVLFVTVTFKKIGRRRRLAEGQAVGEVELDGFTHLYNRACRDLVGRNYHRASHRSCLPKVLAFIDAEGSRYWGSMRDAENLHIHSIWVIPADKTDQVSQSLRRGAATLNEDAPIDAIDIEPIDQGDEHCIRRVVSYSSKLMGHNAAELAVAEDFRVFPS